MSFIIGTAGHIDHGKTSLVRALTGQDTDRLKEEKERGISIDLGFAHLDLPDGTRAGVVDVPGHERFIKNMLAGAHGIDLVLFTVAADDGVMPQTEEHLDIVHLLGVTKAIFVITKADLATKERIRAVADEIEMLTAGSTLAGSPMVAVSSMTGQGLDELRARIVSALGEAGRRAPRGGFRLPVDRVFVLQGHGVVVTGTSLSGTVRAGDQVRALPGAQVFRVRSVQVHGAPVAAAGPGQRVALNLAGTEKSSIARGHVICHEDLEHVSDRFDARIQLTPTNPRPLRNHQRVRVHVGTAERLGKVTLLGTAGASNVAVPPYCQIALDEPVQIMRGDHFVMRDATARWTLAGGVVIHPWASAHRRRDPALVERLEAFAGDDPAAAARAFIDANTAFATPMRDIRHFLNTDDAEAGAILGHAADLRLVAIEDERLYTTSHRWRRLEEAIQSLLSPFHAAHPLVPGMEMEELRSRLPFDVPPRVFRAVVDQLSLAGVVARDANLVRLPGHVVRLDRPEQGLADGIIRLLTDTPLAPPELSQIEQALGTPRPKIIEVMRVLERERTVVRVSPDLYFSRDAVERLKSDVRAHFAAAGEVTPAAFRDRFGTSRKYAIPLLELLDREGVTVRRGDVRRLAGAPVS